MTNKDDSPLLLFYPTSPVHVRDIQLVIDQLADWSCAAVLYRPLENVAPGIREALDHHHIHSIELDQNSALEKTLPANAAVVVLGAVFEPFALELLAWAKFRRISAIAIQEVAQLALNQFDINNYDGPFDRLFVASQEERLRFLQLNYPANMLSVSGLLASDRFLAGTPDRNEMLFAKLGIPTGKKPIVYTTSPLRSRLALHNKDDRAFREKILAQLAEAYRIIGRAVVVKLHPNEDIEINRRMIQNIIPDAFVFGREIGMDELFPITGVLVNRGNSQTCLEAVLRGIPTVVAACGLKTLFHDDGGAYVVDSLEALPRAIETALNCGVPDGARVRSSHFHLPPTGVAKYIASEIAAAPRVADEHVWDWLVKSLLFMGRHDRALALCKKVPIRSRWQELVYSALDAHCNQRPAEAISAWLECDALDPDWYFPHYELAHGFHAIGQFNKAIAHAQKAIELHPPFHSLWHEIPMRVVIMSSLGSAGDPTAAGKELKLLEKRGLVEVIPELLIESAAQHCSFSDQLEAARQCLEMAVEQLNRYPVDPFGDSCILERAARQYIHLARKYAMAGDSLRSTASLTRAIEVARSNAIVLNHICLFIGEQSEKRELAANEPFAEQCYALAIQANPTLHWLRYRQSGKALKQRNFREAFHGLFTLARIPDAPRAIIETIFSAAGAARLAPYWPASPKSIVKPLTLGLRIFGWFLSRLARAGLRDLSTSITPVILVWLFVARHFVQRLGVELSKIRKLLASSEHRVTNCPICGGTRKRFEYQNKQTPLFRCINCNHVYARDLPDERVLNALYGDFGYWERDRYHQGITAVQESEQWQIYLDARIGILEKLKLLNDPSRPRKKLFEIGCAEGMLLHELRKRGMEVMGCEMNRAVAEEGAKKLGVDIRATPFETIELPAKNFDLVMSFHTVEHLRDPAGVIAKVADILRPDGALLLEVPCGEEEYENTDHLHFFSDTSLRTLLNKFFCTTEILDNSYTNGAGVKISSIYGIGRGVRHRTEPRPTLPRNTPR